MGKSVVEQQMGGLALDVFPPVWPRFDISGLGVICELSSLVLSSSPIGEVFLQVPWFSSLIKTKQHFM